MAEKLFIDTGIKEYDINGNGLLRANFADPNLYKRFMELRDFIERLHEEMLEKGENLADTDEMLNLMADYDTKVKEKLSYVFGPGNDFDKLLGGVNLTAMTNSGNMVIVNLLSALAPIIAEGTKEYAKMKAAEAVKAAKADRAKR